MTFIHPLLLGGLLLVGIPVLIHLVMRQKPKRLMFPAVRFLLQRQHSNRRRLQLRHIILLALRMLLIAAICLALARPRVLSERLNIGADQPVAAVMIFDTSFSMGYVAGGKTRLEAAIEQGLNILKSFPDGSRIAVLDTSEQGGEWLAPVGSAKELAREKIAGLDLKPVGFPVTSQLSTALEMLSRQDLNTGSSEEAVPRFIYVFSDRTEACWDVGSVVSLKRVRDQIPSPGVQAAFIDVGVDSPADLAIADLRLERQAISPHEDMVLEATIAATGEAFDTHVECLVDADPIDQRPIRLGPGQSEVIRFERGKWTPGYHQAVVKLGTSDAALPFNDIRYATFFVSGSRKVLVVTDHRTEDKFKEPQDPIFAIALRSGRAFDCDVKLTPEAARLSPKELAAYRAVCLINVASPSEELWESLKQYVDQGGGLAIIPGMDPERNAYNGEKAQALLPARLDKPVILPGEPSLTLNWADAKRHPLMKPFLEWRTKNAVDFFQREGPQVSRYYKLELRPDAADEIISYSDKTPAILERRFDRKQVRGRVLLFTMPLDDSAVSYQGKRKPANDFLETSFYLVLAQRAVGYLAGDTEEANVNFLCGQSVPVALAANVRFPSYTIVGPGLKGQEAIVNRAEKQVELNINQAIQPGNYKLLGKEAVISAFTLNVPPEENRLTRVPTEQIESLLGEGAVINADQKIDLSEALQNHWSQPVELLPTLMILLLLLLAVENLLANKFYRREPESKEPAVSAQASEVKETISGAVP
ncbi:MAG TPA: VWA domain-containing protein [Gemmataceae bacterium]|nr:VWA domain-containing protein [Gemmataceae bacterium]